MRIGRSLTLAAACLVLLLAAGAWTLPAEVAWRYASDRFAPLALRGIGGTVWQGHADSVELAGRDLGGVDWNLEFAPLLRNALIVHVSIAGNAAQGRGVVERAADGEVGLRDVTLHLPARYAAPIFAIPALEPLGTIELQVARARIVGGRLEAAAGTATWRGAAVAGAAQAQLGDLRATFVPAADGSIAGVVEDLGGPLEVAGTFTVSRGRYEVQAQLAARNGDAQVSEALRYVGQPRPDGSRQLEIRGKQLDLL